MLMNPRFGAADPIIALKGWVFCLLLLCTGELEEKCIARRDEIATPLPHELLRSGRRPLMSTVVRHPFNWDNVENELQAAIAQARAISKQGHDPQAATAAWDIVEDIQAELSHQRQSHPKQTRFEEYCDHYPDALESRMYNV
jgi:hypothetical protein